MATAAFNGEFQALSNLPESLDHPFLHLDQFAEVINQLRRKSDKFLAEHSDLLDEEAERFMSSQPTDQGQYQPVKNMIRLLEDQLRSLLGTVDSGGSLEVASEIGNTLDRFGSFINAIAICSTPADPDQATSLSITHLRNRHLFQKCQEFLQTLAYIFGAYLNFLDDIRDESTPNNERNMSRVRLNGLTRHLHDTVDRLMHVFDQPSLKLFQDEWMAYVDRIQELIEESAFQRYLHRRCVPDDPESDEEGPEGPDAHAPLRKRLSGFIQLLKVCRLLINKLYKFTNRKPYLGSYMCFGQLEKVEWEMGWMIDALICLYRIVKTDNPPDIFIHQAFTELSKCINGAMQIIKAHWIIADDRSNEKEGSVEMLRWLHNWRFSYKLALKKTANR